MYSYFIRGNTAYWNESDETVRDCYQAALRAVSRGFPVPGKVQKIKEHPTRLYCQSAWRVNNPIEMG